MEETKEKNIGEFKTPKKFLNFISAVTRSNTKVRFQRETAFIEGKKLSGFLEDSKFKITICDDSTINFEEIGDNKADDKMKERLIESICEKDVTGYAEKFVLSELEFKDKDGNRCYLEVEHEKPIDRISSLLDSFDKEKEKTKKKVSDKTISALDKLFDGLNSKKGEEKDDEVNDSLESSKVKKESKKSSYIEDTFEKMNKEKIKELETRILDKEQEISRINLDISTAKKKKEQEKERLSILKTRLESLKPKADLNGYVFNVSELNKPDISLGEETKKIANKISGMLGLKKDALFDQLKDGYYTIKIADSNDIENRPKDINREALMSVKNLDLDGKMSMVADGEFKYEGELTWHQIVDIMIKSGFEQNEKFDELCGSNSYDEKGESKEKAKSEKSKF